MQAMIRDADVTDLALRFRFQHRLIKACTVAGLRAEGRRVELVNIHVVGLQHGKARLEVFPKAFNGCRGRFRRDDDVVAHIGKCLTDLIFAIRIRACGVEKADAVIVCFAQQLARFFNGNALNGQRAEAVAIDRDAGIAECHCFHSFPVLSKYTYPKISFGLYSVSAVIS